MDEIRIYGALWCGDCRRSKAYLDRHTVPYRWMDIDADEEASRFIEALQGGGRSIPTIVFPDGSHLIEPSNAELAEKLGLDPGATGRFEPGG
jgi:glutaredoxin-like protein